MNKKKVDYPICRRTTSVAEAVHAGGEGGGPREGEREAATASRRALSHGGSRKGSASALGQNRGGGGVTAGPRSTAAEWGSRRSVEKGGERERGRERDEKGGGGGDAVEIGGGTMAAPEG